MMIPSDLRSQIRIDVIAKDPLIRLKLSHVLGDAGYNVRHFEVYEDALIEVRKAPPHVSVITETADGLEASTWLSLIKQISTEIAVVALLSPVHAQKSDSQFFQANRSISLLENGIADCLWMLSMEFEDIVLRMDRLIHQILLAYSVTDLKNQIEKSTLTVPQSLPPTPALTGEFFQTLSKDPNTIIKEAVHFLTTTSHSSAVGFRYLPAFRSLVVIGNGTVSTGLQLREMSDHELAEFQKNPLGNADLVDLICAICPNATDAHTLVTSNSNMSLNGQLLILRNQEGEWMGCIFVATLDLSPSTADQVCQMAAIAFSAGKISQELVTLKRKLMVDEKVGVSNKDGLIQKIEIELRRSSRFSTPLSFLRIGISLNGYTVSSNDLFLQMFGKVLQQFSRQTDAVGYLGQSEFLIVLPHTSIVSARLMETRLKNIFSQMEWPMFSKNDQDLLRFRLGSFQKLQDFDDVESLLAESARCIDGLSL